jgi:hypothetical protein
MASEDEEQPTIGNLAERVPSEDLEAYYAAVIRLLRASITRISQTSIGEFTWLSEHDPDPSLATVLPPEEIPPEGMWLPFNPTDMGPPEAGRLRPPHRIPPEVGFHLVAVVGFAECALSRFAGMRRGRSAS